MCCEKKTREDPQPDLTACQALQFLTVTGPGDGCKQYGCKAEAEGGDHKRGRLSLGKADKDRSGGNSQDRGEQGCCHPACPNLVRFGNYEFFSHPLILTANPSIDTKRL